MLDAVIKLFDVNIELSDRFSKNKTDRIVFNACKAIVYDKTYSELDETTFATLNDNNYGCGFIDFEFAFKENFKNPYMKFFISCFSIRSISKDYKTVTKLNTPRPGKMGGSLYPPNYTKVNQNGNLSFGVRYYFKTMDEKNTVLNSDEVCIEGFVSFGKKNNVYDIMCRIVKTDNGWELNEAYTYRTHPKTYIYSLVH